MKIYIYGAGALGQAFLEFLKEYKVEGNISGFIDKRYDSIKEVGGIRVFAPEILDDGQVYCVLAISNSNDRDELSKKMKDKGIKVISLDFFANIAGMDKVEFNRRFCAFYHVEHMNDYFESCEEEGAINRFWAEDSAFYKLFKQLDLSNVVELACGRGRHVPRYIDQTKKVILVDILEKNIEFCKGRFGNYENITYYVNNGYNLEKIPTETVSSLFTYDAMVHFEMMDIYEYLKDIYRILKKDGKVLIHHSNYDEDYSASFENAPNGRSFMSKQLFAYLAYRVGFTVKEQIVIDWGVKDLDCITLLEK